MGKTITTFKELEELKAEDIMTAPVITAHVGDSIHDIAKIFEENNISSVAVVDGKDTPLGVITKSDLARYDRERATLVTSMQDKKSPRAKETSETLDRKGFHLEPEEATIESWMTPALFDVQPKTILPAIAQKMVKNGLHHIFVTERENKKIRGIITTFDLLMLLSRVLNPVERLLV